MKNKKTQIVLIAFAVVFILLSVFFMFGRNIFSGKGIILNTDSTVMPEATGTTPEIKGNTVLVQNFVNTTDTISNVGIVFTRLQYKQGIDLTIELREGNTILASNSINVSKIEDQHRTYVEPAKTLSGMKGKTLSLRIYTPDKEDTGLAVMMSNKVNATFKIGNKTANGSLCFSVTE